MNTRLVDPRSIWALLAMEAGLALPIISLPAQGDRLPGVLGPLLLLVLLPLGFAGVFQIRELRDPSWRLLGGIGLWVVTGQMHAIIGLTAQDIRPALNGVGHSFVIAVLVRGSACRERPLVRARPPVPTASNLKTQ